VAKTYTVQKDDQGNGFTKITIRADGIEIGNCVTDLDYRRALIVGKSQQSDLESAQAGLEHWQRLSAQYHAIIGGGTNPGSAYDQYVNYDDRGRPLPSFLQTVNVAHVTDSDVADWASEADDNVTSLQQTVNSLIAGELPAYTQVQVDSWYLANGKVPKIVPPPFVRVAVVTISQGGGNKVQGKPNG
jgi:hypothetical protein